MIYEIKWITEYLGVGRAPMSYEEFDTIREQGVSAMVNLCHEFSDLHTLEEEAGFEVYYLPTYDEHAPNLEELEKGLQWLDEALYLKKKVLIHCRFGQGRTGTFTSAYLLRRGLDLKKTKKQLKLTNALPANYRQWKTVKKYKKLQSSLSFHPPRIEHNQYDELTAFYKEYEELADLVDKKMQLDGIEEVCGKKNDCCCNTTFFIPLVEALYLNDCINRVLKTKDRIETIERAVKTREILRGSIQCLNLNHPSGIQEITIKNKLSCPLSVNGSCILFRYRPIRCRANGGVPLGNDFMQTIGEDLCQLSSEVFLSLAGTFPETPGVYASLIDTVSGKFIQNYFHLMASVKQKKH